MIILAGHLKTSPDLVDELLAALDSLLEDTRKEQGCLDLPAIGAVLGGWADKIEIAVRKFDAANERGFTE
jgi:hypothetical protein